MDINQDGVYLIHFESKLAHAQHYIGWAKNINKRSVLHRKGRGSRLVSIINQKGIGWQIARIWPVATRDDERRLKNRAEAPRLCPICTANPKPARLGGRA